MSIAVKNRSRYPAREVGSLIRRVLRDLDVDDIDVIVKDHPHGRLTGRYRASWYPSKGETRESIRMSLASEYPRPWHYYTRMRSEMPPPLEIRSWQEAVVALAAHEGQHHRQTPRNGYGRPGKNGKALPRYREDECEWAAYRAVQRFRDQRVGLAS